MKKILYIAALLLMLTGILHTLPFFIQPQEAMEVPMLVFGIIYFSIGVMLFLKMKFASLLGVIFPIIGLVAGLLEIGIQHLTTMLTILFAIDTIVVFCCVWLLFNKKRMLKNVWEP